MIPIKKCMKIIMPTTESISNNYNPFSDDLIFISGIDNEIQVINSLQRPRKITLRGSDGNNYITLLKPKDDLRKDCRMMDVNDVVSQYLHRDPDSRQRRLHIKTYSVVPLNDECGLIEWILNLVSFRSIILNIYGKKGKYIVISLYAWSMAIITSLQVFVYHQKLWTNSVCRWRPILKIRSGSSWTNCYHYIRQCSQTGSDTCFLIRIVGFKQGMLIFAQQQSCQWSVTC